MKKTIEIEIPEKFPGAEASEGFDPRKQAAERGALAVANTIARRTGTTRVNKESLKQSEKGKGGIEVELDLTQKQIDKLPVGLRKLLK
jgi:hypothetical protein